MTKQTIDIKSLPITERLSIARQLDANGHAEFMGCRVVVGTEQKTKDTGPRSSGQLIYDLAQAHLAKTPKPKAVVEPRRGGFVHGVGFCWDDELA